MSKINWTSIKVVADKILRDPLFIGLTYESIIDYFIDFIHIVGSPQLFDEKIATSIDSDTGLLVNHIPITNYRAELPIDFVEEIQLEIDEHAARTATDTHAKYYNEIKDINYYRQFLDNVMEFTYKISGNYIYLSKETGDLILIYKCVKTQDNVDSEDYGYPMIPDDPVFILALQKYIELEYTKILFRSNKTTVNVLQIAQQDYAWAVGRYDTHSKRLTLGEMESISKMFRGLQQKTNEFKTRFKNLGQS